MSMDLHYHFNIAQDAPPAFATVNDWLVHGFESAKNKTALVFENRSLSYAELDQWSNQIAHTLVNRGIRPGSRVGLCLDRSFELIAVLIGVLKAGASYVPLDPTYPVKRLTIMQEDADLCCLIVHARHAGVFQPSKEIPLIWEQLTDEIKQAALGSVDVMVGPEDAAYIIHTSGSTGRPKGIVMPHRALANLIECQVERRSFRSGARVLQFSSISFDVSFQEIASTLASGGVLHLISAEDQKDPRTLLSILQDQKIERLFLPYVALRSLIETAHVFDLFPELLKEIITAGEQLRVDDAVRTFFTRIGEASLDNQYGPSETHVITAHLLEGNPEEWLDLPPIGAPLKNCGTCILDADMAPVSIGEEGELYLSGRNLACGYIGRDDLTENVFIPNPFNAPERPVLYKTGDLAAYNADGTIKFLGRLDHQIKIRGHRIEPGEINNAASAVAGVGTCLTHAYPGEGGMLQLATYYTAADGMQVTVSALRKRLEAQLPEYMIPSFLIEIETVPYTPSGKVDFKALPKPTIQDTQYGGGTVHYETATEKRLALIWNKLLDLKEIPSHADFFELGGDSLRAVHLFLEIQKEFGLELALSSLIQESTIAGLAHFIDEQATTHEVSVFRSLESIQNGDGQTPPLFMVHGGQGNVLVFTKFARNLGPNQPVYAFKWSGWDGGPGDDSVKKMARAYCDELLRFSPVGPFRLGGYCIGGLIAIEMARLLEQEGLEIIGPLIICDSPNLGSKHYRSDEPWDSSASIDLFKEMVAELNALRKIEGREDIPVDYKPPSGKAALLRCIPGMMLLLRKIKQLKGFVRTLREQIRIQRMLAGNQRVPMDLRSNYALRMLIKAAKHHKGARYSGDVIFFRSDCVVGRYFSLSGWWTDPFLGFKELCDGIFNPFAVGGGHTEIMDRPEVAEIVKNQFNGIEQ